MPIKLPKGFARRKSSGNALEEVPNPPEPSFKVFERPGGGSRSFDGANALKRMRPLSSVGQLQQDDLFVDVRRPQPNNRGSGGTNNSASTGGLYDSSSSSARFSSSSTLPSSTDVPVHGDNNFFKRAQQEKPIPPIPESQPAFSLRAGGRTFSFGAKSPKSPPMGSSHPEPPLFDSPTVESVTRDRAMTASTTSTATPPRLLDSELSFDSGSEGFGNMFDGFGKKKKNLNGQRFSGQNSSSPSLELSPPPVPPKSYYKDSPGLAPSPINVNRSRPPESSPYSWGSRDSQEGLMSSSSPPVAFSPEETPSISRQNLPQSSSPTPLVKSERVGAVPGPGLRRSSMYAGRRQSTPIEDEDARLVQDSVPNNRRTFQQIPSGSLGRNPSPQAPPHRAPAAVFSSDEGDMAESPTWKGDPCEQTPRPKKVEPYRDPGSPTVDTSLAASAHLASQYEERESSQPKVNNKVMTPAQFERYRRQQELTRTRSDASKSDASGEGSDNYDDEDETERNRQAARQRRKQEAHLAVYRQQMMKVTGEQPTDLPKLGQLRDSTDKASMSTPNLPGHLSILSFGNEKGVDNGKSSDDEDEDVPLGILAAHGFPNKNRPPIKLGHSGSASNLRLSSQVGLPGSVVGDSTAHEARNSLPVFARHLPQDPYFGASLVNPSNRESLAMNGAMPGQGQPGPPPGAPPGGLVGVIAGEERARAMRRGSPNPQGGYEPPGGALGSSPVYPGMQRSQTMGNLSTMSPMAMPTMPGMPPMLSPGDQAQMQVSQQMTQMMQVQMQWMHQMMQMQGMQTGQMPPQLLAQPPGTNNFLALPGQIQRPMSIASNPGPASPVLHQDQRTLSMLDPGLSQWRRNSTFAPSINGGQRAQGYTPSIAPSERSNVGMASRYRPVSTAVPPSNNLAGRASTFTSASLQAWNQGPGQPPLQQSQSTSTIKAVNLSAGKAGSDDDDEEEGWAEMKKKRDKKRSTWKMKRGQSALHDIFHAKAGA